MSNENYKFYNRKTISNIIDFFIIKIGNVNIQNCTVY